MGISKQGAGAPWRRAVLAIALGVVGATAAGAAETAPPAAPPATGAATAGATGAPDAPADMPERPLKKLWEYTPTLKSTDLCLDVGGKDGSLVATCGSSKSVRLLAVADGKETWSVGAHDGDVAAVAVTADGETVVTGARDGKAKAWRVKDSAPVSWIEKKDSWFLTADTTPDGKRAVVGDHTGIVRTFPTTPGGGTPPLKNVTEYAVRMLRVAPDGKKFAATDDVAVSIYPLPKGARTMSLEGPGGTIVAVAWSDDGKRLVAATDAGAVRVWDVEAKYKVVGGFEAGKACTGVLYSPKGLKYGAVGAQLVLSHEDGTITFWEASTFSKLAWFRAHASAGGLATAAAGTVLVTIGDEGVVASWAKPFPSLDGSSGAD